ncbi:MAG: UDP-3-O-(3-hydroxymyristoyl)glucosamine N-acyltransferase [Polyangiaceae bacterium]
MTIALAPRKLADQVARHGGKLRSAPGGGDIADVVLRSLEPVESAGRGSLAPLLALRYVAAARAAVERGAVLLIDAALAAQFEDLPGWVHPYAGFTLAELLTYADVTNEPARVAPDAVLDASVLLAPRVIVGRNVSIGAYSVIGQPGFGFVPAPSGDLRRLPHLAGVIIEDDVSIGSHVTIDAGTLHPTILRRGVKIDSHVHIGHNCEIGAGTLIAAQSGLAGSVRVGASVLIGGQVGIADHVHVGDGARIAAKSGVIGDVDPGVTVAGYPAVLRARWLRGIAETYRSATLSDAEEAEEAEAAKARAEKGHAG